MSVVDKIKEAKFFLDKINENYDVFPDVQYYFNAFLNSSYSIPAHLLEDYNKKYVLGIKSDQKLSVKAFEQQAKKLNKTDAIVFILWYKQSITKIKSTTIGKVISNKRHQSTHRESVEVEDFGKIRWGKFLPEDRIKQIQLANTKLPKTVFHTEELAYIEVRDCDSFLISMIDLVLKAIEKFPNELLDVKF